ncbi:putative bromodomain-containing protein 10 [Rhinophrynus dorsalis]
MSPYPSQAKPQKILQILYFREPFSMLGHAIWPGVTPMFFTKILAVTMAFLRQKGIRVFPYLYDILIVEDSEYKSRRNTAICMEILSMLGWIINMNLKDKTSIAVTSKARCGVDQDKGDVCTSVRRRSTTRSLASLNTGAVESVIVQVVRQEELLKAKEEKRLREQERHEAEEACQKELEEWDRSLLAMAEPTSMETMWEIPAIGHFLCLAQQILNLPEIVFYELERCLLMPQCNVFLSKIITSLLSPPHRRPTLHRRPNLPYRAWETALRQKVQQWYTVIGQAENPDRCAEKLGLCSQFFKVLGEVNPLEQKAFHELSFYQKVWLLKGLCDFVYETQSEVQDAVLSQPIHECREVILGYDSQENAYIHFPQFCGADVRVYKQRPFRAPEFPLSPIEIKRMPRTRMDKGKCKFSNKSNGDMRSVELKVASSNPGSSPKNDCVHLDDCTANIHTGSCNSSGEQDVKSGCETKIHRPCDIQTDCCKENVVKPVSPGEVVGYGEPLSPGEIRILENVEKYGEATILKADLHSLKENLLKTCQAHVNGRQTETPDVICHRLAMDIIIDHSLINHKKLKLGKIRAKKKKKKKKKLKNILNEDLQRKCDSMQTQTFKTYKNDIQNKLYLTKKRAKHKKHKSGKKSVSKKAVTKKRKTIASSSSAPEFQLVCTNLDELRELIKKIEGELKNLENNKKKSEKWHFRKQGVKELHNTLIRLLNELLPWEPKLLKAFQKNRARLKKDYDDFKRLSDCEHFTMESCTHEELETSKSSNSATNMFEGCHQEILKKEELDTLKLSEMDITGMGNLMKKDFTRELLKCPPKTCKRQCKQYSCLNTEEKEISPRKKPKLVTHEDPSLCIGSRSNACCSLGDSKQMLSETPEVTADSVCASLTRIVKGTKPIQELLAKNIGDKVTLTSQLKQPTSKNIPACETSELSPTGSVPSKPFMSCQTTSKTPLQMIYKLPDGQCIPIDLQNSQVKIQMQPVIDSKTGEKIMQQVLFLPKNLFIQPTEEKATKGESKSMQSETVGQHCASNVTSPNFSTHCGTSDTTAQLAPPVLQKCVINLPNQSLPVVSQQCVSAAATNVKISQCEKSKSNTPVLPNFTTSLVPSVMTIPVPPDTTGATPGKGNTIMANHHTVNLSPTLLNDSSETKQELKTVCIRDSQSILVRTRGGNTGVVKVQTGQDQSSVISPSSIFTFTPQLQSFLVSKTKTSASCTSVAPAPAEISQTSSTVSGGQSQLTEANTNSTQRASSSSGIICQVADKPMQSSNLSAMSSKGHWLPTNSHSNMNITTGLVSTLTCDNKGQGSTAVALAAADIKENEPMDSNKSVVQPYSASSPSRCELINGPTLHKFMLIPSPPIVSSSSVTKMNMVTTPATSAVTSQKLVFINAQVPLSSSTNSLSLQHTKQAAPSFIGKTYVKNADQPQIFLIPSPMGTPMKINSAPIVSQVKDVKIGLTIGQTIVNTSGSAKSILPINMLHDKQAKGEEQTHKGFAMSSVSNLISSIQNGGQGANQNVGYDCTAATAKGPASAAAATSVCSAITQSNAIERSGNKSSIVPALTTRLYPTTVGNTVAISTVKTGHLSSSVLLSTTPMTGHAKSAFSSLQIPISSILSASGVTSHVIPSPSVAAYPPVSKELIEMAPLPSQVLPNASATNVTKPQAVLATPSAITISTPGPTPAYCQSTSHAFQTFLAPPTNQVIGQLNESCIQQKIVINTSTPLAPGTQITVNGNRFIIPPQGLSAGSHVLLMSNTKPGLSLAGNCGHVCYGSSLNNATAQQTSLIQNTSLDQHLNHPFNISKSMNSFGTANSSPTVHAIPHFVNTSTKDFSPCPVTSVDGSSLTSPQLTAALKPLFVPALQKGSSPQPSSTSQLPSNRPDKDRAVLSAPLSPTTLSDHKNADTTFPGYQSSVPDKPNFVAS